MKGMSPAMWQRIYSMDDWMLERAWTQDDPAEPPYWTYRLRHAFTQQTLYMFTFEGDAIAQAPIWRKRALIQTRVRGNSASWVTGTYAPAL